MSKDFKTKYFEKADKESSVYLSYDAIGAIESVYEDLFPLINEMREALEKYKGAIGFVNSDCTTTLFTDKEKLPADQALKNLDDFVGGGE